LDAHDADEQEIDSDEIDSDEESDDGKAAMKKVTEIKKKSQKSF